MKCVHVAIGGKRRRRGSTTTCAPRGRRPRKNTCFKACFQASGPRGVRRHHPCDIQPLFPTISSGFLPNPENVRKPRFRCCMRFAGAPIAFCTDRQGHGDIHAPSPRPRFERNSKASASLREPRRAYRNVSARSCLTPSEALEVKPHQVATMPTIDGEHGNSARRAVARARLAMREAARRRNAKIGIANRLRELAHHVRDRVRPRVLYHRTATSAGWARTPTSWGPTCPKRAWPMERQIYNPLRSCKPLVHGHGREANPSAERQPARVEEYRPRWCVGEDNTMASKARLRRPVQKPLQYQRGEWMPLTAHHLMVSEALPTTRAV